MSVEMPKAPPRRTRWKSSCGFLRSPHIRREAPEVLAAASRVLLEAEMTGRAEATIRTPRKRSGLPVATHGKRRHPRSPHPANAAHTGVAGVIRRADAAHPAAVTVDRLLHHTHVVVTEGRRQLPARSGNRGKRVVPLN